MSLIHRLEHYLLPHPTNNHKPRLLHPSPLVIITGIFVLIQLLISRPQIGPAILGYASNITSEAIISLTNLKRQSAGTSPVNLDAQLSQAAAAKAADMLAHDYWAHVSPSGTEPWYFITSANYKYLLAGENLARDFNDSGGVVEAWMNSPTHKENLLNPKYQDIGVAVVNGKLGGVETSLVVQMFGTRLASSPQVGQSSIARAVQAAPQPPTSPPLTGGSPLSTPTPIPPTPTMVITSTNSIAPGETTSFTVATPQLMISPFTITRGIASLILIFLIVLFIVDAAIVYRRQIVRLSSDTTAHIAFLLTITAAIWLIRAGVIL